MLHDQPADRLRVSVFLLTVVTSLLYYLLLFAGCLDEVLIWKSVLDIQTHPEVTNKPNQGYLCVFHLVPVWFCHIASVIFLDTLSPHLQFTWKSVLHKLWPTLLHLHMSLLVHFSCTFKSKVCVYTTKHKLRYLYYGLNRLYRKKGIPGLILTSCATKGIPSWQQE